MPIRINLLAEAQLADDQRRKDPVKRALLGAGAVLVLGALWAGWLQFNVLRARAALGEVETRWSSIEKAYKIAVDSQRRSIETEDKLSSLQQMTTNRFLWASALNAFQQTLAGIENVNLVRVKTEQVYSLLEETKARTNGTTVTPARPASATERIRILVDAQDVSGTQGGRATQYKEAIAAVPWFRDNLNKTNGVMLISMGSPQITATGKSGVVPFTLQCNFPEKTR